MSGTGRGRRPPEESGAGGGGRPPEESGAGGGGRHPEEPGAGGGAVEVDLPAGGHRVEAAEEAATTEATRIATSVWTSVTTRRRAPTSGAMSSQMVPEILNIPMKTSNTCGMHCTDGDHIWHIDVAAGRQIQI